MAGKPTVVILAGANGAGKSTCAVRLIPAKTTFINADDIAKALPESFTGKRDMEGARRLLTQFDKLARARRDFVVETTLASRSIALRLPYLHSDGYAIHLFFLWVPSADLSIERVATRVRRGGHDVPVETIRRRWASGLRNFFVTFQRMADEWRVYQNLDIAGPQLIASGSRTKTNIEDRQTWLRIQRQARYLRDKT